MPGAAVSFGRTLCQRFEDAVRREWLETNGRGGYAQGTVAGANTRRYHGLLTTARRPPLDRIQWVNRLDETVVRSGARRELSNQKYPDVVHPRGWERLEEFRLDPCPRWTYSLWEGRLEKSLYMRYGEDAAVVVYRLLAGPRVDLEVRPLLSLRDHHALGREDGRFESKVRVEDRRVLVEGPGATLVLAASEGSVESSPAWYRNQTYELEERRGLDFREDVFGPAVFRLPLELGKPVRLVMSVGETRSPVTDMSEAEEWRQRRRIAQTSLVRGSLGGALASAADQFIVQRGEGSSVIAGYPWFGDWSRDALIAFPGLFLATGRWEEAPGLLDTYAGHLRQGLLPNRFPEGAEPAEYNAMDAPLWFIRAVQAYHRATQDDDRVRRWLPAVREILDAYQNGADLDIGMEDDGLIAAPAGERALTWMDARVDGRPVTPRGGKPVEIQALWYNALQFACELQLRLKEPTRGYDQLAQVARKSFNEKFWNEERQCLFDVVDGKRRDGDLRPNGLLAVSLPYEILEETRFRPVVETAWWELHTPLGLRTLAPGSPGYASRYGGPPAERDRAYHRGTAWPWLLGPFLTAYVKAFGSGDDAKAQVLRFLQPVANHVLDAGAGQLAEVADGDAPHAPGGCPAQAWSVAEVLRVMWEEGITL